MREIATISTSMGDMEFELFSDVSPRAVANFKYLADTKFYDNTAFHRHIKDFMVQGGCPLTRGTTVEKYSDASAYAGSGGPEYTIPNEPTTRADRAHVRGVISMAKTAAPDSGGSQFFIMFGRAEWLDNVHAPMGRIIAGQTVLDAIEARPKDAKDMPFSPIVIQSVRVRAEGTGETPSLRMAFQPGTYGGLLRPPDRNHDVFGDLVVAYNQGANNGAPRRGPLQSFDKNMDARGSYQLSLTRGGGFSAQIQYYGRRNTFTGCMVRNSSSLQEAVYAGILNPGSAAPMRVRIRARETALGTTSVSVAVSQVGPDGGDLEDGSGCVSDGALAPPSVVAERYNIELAAPLKTVVKTDATPASTGLRGAGFLTANIRAASGLALVTGRLPDGSPLTFSRPVSNEGGRLTLPVYIHELQPNIEASRSEFPSVKLSDWYSLSKLFDFPYFKNRFAGLLELPPKPTLLQPQNEDGNWLIWVRQGRQGGPASSMVLSYVVPKVAAWTPPVPGQTLPPFASGAKAQLSAEAFQVGRFQIAKTNAGGVFDATTAAPQLWFNPTDGTFRGSFIDTTLSAKPRRTFQGVLLQKQGLNRGTGFMLTETECIPVSLTP